jgi:hypothetical protein
MFYITRTDTGEWVQYSRKVTVEGENVRSWSGLCLDCTATPITVGMAVKFKRLVDNRYVVCNATVQRVNGKAIMVETDSGTTHTVEIPW